MEDADRADGGGRGVDGRMGGEREALGQKRGKWADGGQMGGGWVDGRTARKIEADGRTSGWADKNGRGANKADGWQSEQTRRKLGFTGGQARGLKGPAPHSPIHSLALGLLASMQSEFAGRLEVHWGPNRVYGFYLL